MYHRLINEEDDYGPNDLNTFEFKNRSKESKKNQNNNAEALSLLEIDPNHYDLIEHTIMPNETLNGIALRYNCTVSQLRLINHLMSDQDFHMLKTLRIPVLKHGLFTDPNHKDQVNVVNDLVDVSENHQNTATSNNNVSPKTHVINIGISKYLNENNDENNKDYQQFLNNLKVDLEEIRKFNESKMNNEISTQTTMIANNNNNNNNTNLHTTTTTTTTIVNSDSIKSFIHCDGSDYGIHLKYLIIFAVFICILVPFYVLYHFENHSHNQSHHGSHLH